MLRSVKKVVAALLVITLMGNGLPIHVWAENHETVEQQRIINNESNWFEGAAEDTELLANKIKNDLGIDALAPQSLEAESEVLQTSGVEGGYEYADIAGGVVITKYRYNGYGNLIVPETLDGKKVLKIGDKAFYGCSGFSGITLPKGLQSIGNEAFRICTGITSIEIPEGVTIIGNSAFESCTRLSRVSFPSTLVNIENQAFWSCDVLNNVIIPEGVISIGWEAFSCCDFLETVRLPNSLKTLVRMGILANESKRY